MHISFGKVDAHQSPDTSSPTLVKNHFLLTNKINSLIMDFSIKGFMQTNFQKHSNQSYEIKINTQYNASPLPSNLSNF